MLRHGGVVALEPVELRPVSFDQMRSDDSERSCSHRRPTCVCPPLTLSLPQTKKLAASELAAVLSEQSQLLKKEAEVRHLETTVQTAIIKTDAEKKSFELREKQLDVMKENIRQREVEHAHEREAEHKKTILIQLELDKAYKALNDAAVEAGKVRESRLAALRVREKEIEESEREAIQQKQQQLVSLREKATHLESTEKALLLKSTEKEGEWEKELRALELRSSSLMDKENQLISSFAAKEKKLAASVQTSLDELRAKSLHLEKEHADNEDRLRHANDALARSLEDHRKEIDVREMAINEEVREDAATGSKYAVQNTPHVRARVALCSHVFVPPCRWRGFAWRPPKLSARKTSKWRPCGAKRSRSRRTARWSRPSARPW